MDLKKIKELYSSNVREYGTSSKAVGWKDKRSQLLRFEKLTDGIPKHDPFSVNELGCGYGELVRFFENNGFPLEQYNGFDISEEMVDAAQKYIDFDKAVFSVSSVLDKKADYSITSGIFNVKFSESNEGWERYIFETIRNMWEQSRKGISFNLLSKYVDWEDDNLYYGDPGMFLNFCLSEFSCEAVLLHDYPLFEWTMILKKKV